MRIAVTGPTDITFVGETIVREKIRQLVMLRPEVMIFGGARGVDTVALVTARQCRLDSAPLLQVIVPATVERQPKLAREAIRECADEVIELKLPPRMRWIYLKRNEEMVRRADRLIAFWAPFSRGTQHTRDCALRKGIPVEVIEVP